jgi:hypothetical protein
MRRVYGAKVMRLTPGDLPDCFELAWIIHEVEDKEASVC